MAARRSAFARTSLLVFVVVLALLGGLAWWMLHGGSNAAPIKPVAERPKAVEPMAAPANTPAIEAMREAAPVREAQPAPVPGAIDPRPAPEAFTRELSGLHGRLVEQDGTPVPNLKVELLRAQFDVLLASIEGGFSEPPAELVNPVAATTFAALDGTFELHGVPVGGFTLLGVDLGGGRATARMLDVALERGQSCDLGDVVLPPHVTFTGKVLDEEGNAIAGARVRVLPQLPWPIPPQVLEVGIPDVRMDCAALVNVEPIKAVVEPPAWFRAAFDRFPIPTTTTATDGTFRLPGIPAGVVTVFADRAGHVGVVRGGIATGRRTEMAIGELRLANGRTASGQVLAGSEPVAGVHLYVGAQITIPGMPDGAVVALGQPAGVTDADGRFTIRGLPESGDLVCGVQRRAGDPWLLVGPIGGDPAAIKIELPACADLTVAVNDAAGQPVTGAELRFLEVSPMNELPIVVRPKALPSRVKEPAPGRFVASGLPIGKWTVLARAEGHGIASTIVDLVAEGATATIALPAARTVTVRVFDAAAAPIDYALVSAMNRDEGGPATVFTVARTDPAGDATLRALPVDRKLLIRVTHPGYATTTVALPENAGANGEHVEVALLRGGDLVGKVHHKGEPPGKPLMLVLTDRNGGGPGPEKTVDEEAPRFALTLPDGTFRVRHLPLGKWRYMVYGRFLAVDPLALVSRITNEPDELASGEFEILEGQETALDIDALPDGAAVNGSIHGDVRVDGVVVVDAQVSLRGRRWQQTQTDATGRFEFAEVKPGKYELVVERRDRSNDAGGSSGTISSQSIELQPAEQREVRIDARLVRRTVLVRMGDGTPAAHIAVVAIRVVDPSEARGTVFSGGGNVNTTTDDNGRATLELPRGSYIVKARDDERGRGKTTLDASTADGPQAEIVLESMSSIPCRVVFDGPSKPSADRKWQLWISPRIAGNTAVAFDEDSTLWTELDPDQPTFELKGFTPGHYSAQLYGPGQGPVQSQLAAEFDIPADGLRELVLTFKTR